MKKKPAQLLVRAFVVPILNHPATPTHVAAADGPFQFLFRLVLVHRVQGPQGPRHPADHSALHDQGGDTGQRAPQHKERETWKQQGYQQTHHNILSFNLKAADKARYPVRAPPAADYSLGSLPSLQMRRDLWHQIVKGTAIAVFADRVHFPFAVMAIQLGHDLRRVGALHRQVETGDFLLVARIDNAAIGVFHLRKILAREAVDGEHQAFHLRWHVAQVDIDLLIVAIAGAGTVIARVHNAAVAAFQLAEPDDIGQLAAVIEQHAGRVEVDRFGFRAEAEKALGLDGTPAQAHGDAAQAGASFLVQRDLLALAQIDRHTFCS